MELFISWIAWLVDCMKVLRLLQRWLLSLWCHKLRSWLRNGRKCLSRWTKLILLMHLLSTYICGGMVLPPREIRMILPIWIVCFWKWTNKWSSIIIQCICFLNIVFKVTSCGHICVVCIGFAQIKHVSLWTRLTKFTHLPKAKALTLQVKLFNLAFMSKSSLTSYNPLFLMLEFMP